MDGPFLGPLGLAFVGEVGVRAGQGAPGGPAGEDQGVGQAGPDEARLAARARVIRWARWASVAGGTIRAPRLPGDEPLDDLVDVGRARLIARVPVGVEVPADRLGPEDVAFEPELGLADADLASCR